MRNILTISLMGLTLALAGCPGGSGDDDDDTGTPDGGGVVQIPDAALQADAPPPACAVNPQITEQPVDGTNSAAIRTTDMMGTPILVWNFVTNGSDPKPDLIQFVQDDPVTLNTPLELVQACTQGVTYCLVLLGNIDAQQNEEMLFFPDTGTMTITEAGQIGGRFKATITNATFNHYVCGANGCQLQQDGCSTTAASITVDVEVVAPTKPAQPGQKIVPAFKPVRISR